MSKLQAVELEKQAMAAQPPYMRSIAMPNYSNPSQPASFKNYQKLPIDEENGGAHKNCGIPNHAFFTAAVTANGPPWEGVGKVWFSAMTNRKLGAECTFARFAAFTMAYAKRDYPQLVEPIAKGWKTVGVDVVPNILKVVEGLLSNSV